MLIIAVKCYKRDNMISRNDRLRNKNTSNCTVDSLRAEKPDPRTKFLICRCIFTLLTCWVASRSGFNHYIPTETQYPFKCGEEVWFCPENGRVQEISVEFPTMCQHRCSILSHGF